MAERIRTRGPDGSGTWIDSNAGLALGHRRLAVIDRSTAGHQPMISPCDRFVLVYNGELYNNKELRSSLEHQGGAFNWRGHSDTETLLAALRHWGVQGALSRVNGMFAFALWDKSERRLFLARDRLGEKPIYYGNSGDSFLFGSELKALSVHPAWRGAVDRNVLALYLRHSCVPSPWSIYQNIFKLPPAHFIAIGKNGHEVGRPHCYWSLDKIAEKGAESAEGQPDDMADELDSLLRDSVRRRMVADVPLGAFLSGGIDSSAVVAAMQAECTQPVRTFSIGFNEKSYNEAQFAKRIARHLGTDHTEQYVTAEDAMKVIPALPSIYDEPFADVSQIPTYLVSKLARRDVTVCLSGDGGDELFCGYNRHIVGPPVWARSRQLPRPVRRLLGDTLSWTTSGGSRRWLNYFLEKLGVPHAGSKLQKVAAALRAQNETAFYRSLVSCWQQPELVVLGALEPDTLMSTSKEQPALPGLRETMMYLDMMTYLPDDIMVKVDRASMAVSLEARIPFLDHRLVEFAWRVPQHFKYREGQGKWLLRQVLYRYVPKELIERPKMGFGLPIEHWLRGPLREWAEGLLDARRLIDEGFFDSAIIRDIWNEHLAGRQHRHHQLWSILMFQGWLEHQDRRTLPSLS